MILLLEISVSLQMPADQGKQDKQVLQDKQVGQGKQVQPGKPEMHVNLEMAVKQGKHTVTVFSMVCVMLVTMAQVEPTEIMEMPVQRGQPVQWGQPVQRGQLVQRGQPVLPVLQVQKEL